MKDKRKTVPKIFLRLAILLVVMFVVYSVLLIQDAIVKSSRSRHSSEPVSINQNNGEIPAYNVEGLTDEEIDRLIELRRLNERGK